MSWQPYSMGEQPLHSLPSSLLVHSLAMGSNPLRMAKDYCTIPLLHCTSTPALASLGLCTAAYALVWFRYKGQSFGSWKIWKQTVLMLRRANHSSHSGELFDYSRECNTSPTWLDFKISLVIQSLCRLQGCLGMVLHFSCQGFWSGAEASATVPEEFFFAPKQIYLITPGAFRLYAEC